MSLPAKDCLRVKSEFGPLHRQIVWVCAFSASFFWHVLIFFGACVKESRPGDQAQFVLSQAPHKLGACQGHPALHRSSSNHSAQQQRRRMC